MCVCVCVCVCVCEKKVRMMQLVSKFRIDCEVVILSGLSDPPRAKNITSFKKKCSKAHLKLSEKDLKRFVCVCVCV